MGLLEQINIYEWYLRPNSAKLPKENLRKFCEEFGCMNLNKNKIKFLLYSNK